MTFDTKSVLALARLLLLACVAAAASLMGGQSRAAQDFVVEAERRGAAVSVAARVTLTAPIDLIWSTLTDYDHLSEFIPGMRSSRVTGHRGTASIVTQEGEAGFLFFRIPINVVVESAEYPPNVIEIRVVSGNLKQLDGRYSLETGPVAGQWVLRWDGLIEPQLPLPPLIGERAMRRNIEAQFRGMVAEIERRQAAANSTAAAPRPAPAKAPNS